MDRPFEPVPQRHLDDIRLCRIDVHGCPRNVKPGFMFRLETLSFREAVRVNRLERPRAFPGR